MQFDSSTIHEYFRLTHNCEKNVTHAESSELRLRLTAVFEVQL